RKTLLLRETWLRPPASRCPASTATSRCCARPGCWPGTNAAATRPRRGSSARPRGGGGREGISELPVQGCRGRATDTGETVILMRMIGRAAVCVHRVQSAQRLRIEYEPGATLPIERGASGKLLLAGLTPQARKDLLAPLAQRDPDAAALLEARVARAAQQGFATSEEEIYQGVWAASAAVVQGKRTLAALTVPSPLVRASAEERKQLLDQVRAAAARINTELRAARR